MAVTYNPDTQIGKVRLLITDTDIENPIFSDEEITNFLSITEIDGERDVRLAAAQALEVMASSEAIVQKKLSMLDLTTDGPAVAKSLRESAKALRDRVEEEPAFGWAEQSLNPAVTYEIIRKNALREY